MSTANLSCGLVDPMTFPNLDYPVVGAGRSRAMPAEDAPFCDLTCYDYADIKLPIRVMRFLHKIGCTVLRRKIMPMHLFSGVESYKMIVTLDVTNADLAELKRWAKEYSQQEDMDLVFHFHDNPRNAA